MSPDARHVHEHVQPLLRRMRMCTYAHAAPAQRVQALSLCEGASADLAPTRHASAHASHATQEQ